MLAFAAISKDDTIKDCEQSAGKLLKVRLWDDDGGARWKRSVQDIGGEILCISQFTLLASTKKGNKPDFHKSAGPEKGKELYSAFFKKVQELYNKDRVKDGVFQAMMDVALVNDGPVGLNYISEDGVVNAPSHVNMDIVCSRLSQVTVEIDTNPPPLEMPRGSRKGTMSVDDLVDGMQKINKEFVIPAELLQ